MSSWIAPNHLSASSPFPENAGIEAKAFFDAACEIDRRTSEVTGSHTSAGSETGIVEAWARVAGKIIDSTYFDSLTVVSNATSEHEVFYREVDSRAVKRTWPGAYGFIPSPDQDKRTLGRKNASPAEYLHRMMFQILLFESDVKLEGVMISDKPSVVLGAPPRQATFVISQKFFKRASKITIEDITKMLEECGFQHVPKAFFGWVRKEDRIVLIDARPDNFVNTEIGLIPIDLQITQFTVEEMQLAGLV